MGAPLLRRIFRSLPQGSVSLVEKVRHGAMPGRISEPLAVAPEFSSDSLVKRSGLNQDGFRDWPVFWAHCGETRLIGRSLLPLDKNGLVFEEAIFGAQFLNYDRSCIVPNIGKELFLSGRWTSISSRWDDNYWHFLMDALPRLSMLNEIPDDVGILVHGPLAGWQKELLQLMGVWNRVRETTERRLRVENYYFLSPTAMTGTWNPSAVEFLRKRLLSSVINARPETDGEPLKIFIHRGSSWGRGVVNAKELCDFFAEQGWQIVEPETLSVKNQIQLFSQASAVCGLHGSALTNILWAPAGCYVLELCADNFILGSFEWLARCLGQPHSYMILKGSRRRKVAVDLEALQKKLSFFEGVK